MKYEIELTTAQDVQNFMKAVEKVECDVRLRGKDEHGTDWELSAKSMLCVLLLGGHIHHRFRTTQDIDMNTIYCECERDIYHVIKDFVKE